MAEKKIYSTMQRPLPVVPTGGDIAKDSMTKAASYASAGSAFGPWGTVIGAGIGATQGVVQGISNQKEMKSKLASALKEKAFYEGLDLRDMNQSESVAKQAKKGMKGRYLSEDEEIEMENNEIHVDKNYNIKKAPTNGKTHEEGGIDTVLKSGDAVLPTQNKADRQKVMSAIRRYKLNGDERAKKFLDKIKSKLPEASEVEKAFGGSQNSEIDEITGKSKNPFSDPSFDVNTDEVLNPKIKEENVIEARDPYDVLLDKGETFSEIPGKTRAERRAGYADKYNLNYLEAKKRAGVTGDEWGKGTKNNPNNFGEMVDKWVGYNSLPNNSLPNDEVKLKDISETPNNTPINYGTNLPDPELKESNNTLDEQESDNDPESSSFSEKANKVLKYSSIVNNLITGQKPIEEISRRFYNPENLRYTDRSAYDRRSIAENRNFQMGSLRGKGISAGQQQSYAGQIGSRYLSANERANQLETQRFDTTRNYNIAQRNQAALQNLGLSNQYDDIDRQSKAVRKRYSDVGLSELATIAQVNEQRDYMKARNKKEDERDQKVLNSMRTRDYYLDEDWNTIYGEKPVKKDKASLKPGLKSKGYIQEGKFTQSF